MLGCSRYMNTSIGSNSLLCLSTGHLGCRQVFRESRVLCRLVQTSLSTSFDFWVIFKLDLEFVSNSNSEYLIDLIHHLKRLTF